MTPAQFVKWSEAYYGDYRPVVKVELLRWLEERGEPFISGLRIRVMHEYSNTYRMPPDIAKLKEFIEQTTFDEGRKVLQLAGEKRLAIEGGER